MNLRINQMISKRIFKNGYGTGVYAQVGMIRQRESDDKN